MQRRAVAYLNVDLIPGNLTLALETVPSLYILAAQVNSTVCLKHAIDKEFCPYIKFFWSIA